jgi:hypothetical protein
MLRRGCALIVVCFVALFAAYLAFFTRYFEWPGNLFAAFFGALFGGIGISSLGQVAWAWRDLRAFARAARRGSPGDGELVAVAGPIRPVGAPLTSPFLGHPCVAYEYEVLSEERAGRGRKSSRPSDLAGFAMTAAAVETAHGGVRLLGFPILDQFPQEGGGPDARARAAQYAASTAFDETTRGLRALRLFAEFDDALADADGVVRKDFRLTAGAIPFERRVVRERVVRPGQQVCAVGRYDAEKRALVPRGATPNRLWPGTLDSVRRRVVAAARSQTLAGLSFFLVSHAMLGAAFYLSETRHAREPEDRQASVIRTAVQENDVAALERAVRRGANPDARDTFGDVALLDVRDPAMAAALIRLGADVDARAREGGDTLLIRAARMGNVALVNVLLAARANVHVQNVTGATPLGEAIRGGHEEVAALLRAAGATTDDVPLERPSIELEPPRPGTARPGR